MGMDSKHMGFFAVPAAYHDELTELRERLDEAVREIREDYNILYNQLYCRAREVALHHDVVDGWDARSAWASIGGELLRRCGADRKQDVFTPEQTQSIAQALARSEQRAGGPDELVSRIVKRKRYNSPEAIAPVYKAFRETLMAATTLNAGFLSAVLDDNAEAELAERHRQDEIRRQEGEEWARLPPAPGPTPGELLDAYIERETKRREAAADANSERLATAWLCVVPEPDLGDIHAILDKAYAYLEIGREMGAKRSFGEARELALARATQVDKIRKFGEYTALSIVYALVRNSHPGLLDPYDLYTAAQAQAILAAIRQWEDAHGGAIAAAEMLAARTELKQRLVTRGCRGFTRALAASVKQASGFVLVVDDSNRFFESGFARGGDLVRLHGLET